MIEVTVNQAGFEYDIHSLVKAFFPGEEVSVRVQEDFTEAAGRRMKVVFTQEMVTAEVLEDGSTKESRHCPIDPGNRKETKTHLKQMIYRALAAYTGQELPWGTLTGIRPVKIAMQLLEDGKSNVETAAYMRNVYLASREKAALSVMIANKERHVLQGIDYKDGYSLYVGIPFCPSTCLYCSFASYPLARWENRMDDYLEALFFFFFYAAEQFGGRKLNTVYVGGGTPTTLSPERLDRLLVRIRTKFDLSHVQEFTVEAGRPDSITEEKLKVLLEHGIDRISINPQTMKDETLRIIGRHHTVEQTKEAYALARRMGFSHINMDLIVGLPGEGYEDVEHTMQEIAVLAPDSVTIHSLAIKRAARLNLFREKYEEMGLHNNMQIMDMTAGYCAQMGLFPYYLYRQKNMAGNFENVGYAKADRAGIYNILMMEEKQDIVACGAGTISKRVYPDGRIERCENVKEVAQYMERIHEMTERKRKLFSQGI